MNKPIIKLLVSLLVVLILGSVAFVITQHYWRNSNADQEQPVITQPATEIVNYPSPEEVYQRDLEKFRNQPIPTLDEIRQNIKTLDEAGIPHSTSTAEEILAEMMDSRVTEPTPEEIEEIKKQSLLNQKNALMNSSSSSSQ